MTLDLDSYFGRIGWRGAVAPTREVLAGLCLRHTASVSFENLDILLGRPIVLDLESLFDKIVARRRGGYCFEQNGLFRAVLEQLGFRVTPLQARVRLGVAADVHTPRTHMLLRVDFDDGPFIADVGFGFTPTGPLRLEAGTEQTLHLDTYRFTRGDAVWTLEIRQGGAFVPAYVFTEEPHAARRLRGRQSLHVDPSPIVFHPGAARHAPRSGARRAAGLARAGVDHAPWSGRRDDPRARRRRRSAARARGALPARVPRRYAVPRADLACSSRSGDGLTEASPTRVPTTRAATGES